MDTPKAQLKGNAMDNSSAPFDSGQSYTGKYLANIEILQNQVRSYCEEIKLELLYYLDTNSGHPPSKCHPLTGYIFDEKNVTYHFPHSICITMCFD